MHSWKILDTTSFPNICNAQFPLFPNIYSSGVVLSLTQLFSFVLHSLENSQTKFHPVSQDSSSQWSGSTLVSKRRPNVIACHSRLEVHKNQGFIHSIGLNIWRMLYHKSTRHNKMHELNLWHHLNWWY